MRGNGIKFFPRKGDLLGSLFLTFKNQSFGRFIEQPPFCRIQRAELRVCGPQFSRHAWRMLLEKKNLVLENRCSKTSSNSDKGFGLGHMHRMFRLLAFLEPMILRRRWARQKSAPIFWPSRSQNLQAHACLMPQRLAVHKYSNYLVTNSVYEALFCANKSNSVCLSKPLGLLAYRPFTIRSAVVVPTPLPVKAERTWAFPALLTNLFISAKICSSLIVRIFAYFYE